MLVRVFGIVDTWLLPGVDGDARHELADRTSGPGSAS